jgi:hypothetical protein
LGDVEDENGPDDRDRERNAAAVVRRPEPPNKRTAASEPDRCREHEDLQHYDCGCEQDLGDREYD